MAMYLSRRSRHRCSEAYRSRSSWVMCSCGLAATKPSSISSAFSRCSSRCGPKGGTTFVPGPEPGATAGPGPDVSPRPRLAIRGEVRSSLAFDFVRGRTKLARGESEMMDELRPSIDWRCPSPLGDRGAATGSSLRKAC